MPFRKYNCGDIDRFELYAFFHVYTKYPFFHEIIKEFRRTALRSKIFEKFKRITYCFVRFPKWDFEYPPKISDKEQYIDIPHRDHEGNPYGEWPTLRELYNFCDKDRRETALVYYQHTKGLRRNGHDKWVGDSFLWDYAGDWRRCMMYWNLEAWKIMADKFLDEKVAAGGINLVGRKPKSRDIKNRPWLRSEPPMWCFGGNFWWARASAVASLCHPDSREAHLIVTPKGHKRVGADEHWISGVGVDRMLCMYQTQNDHYHHTFPRGKYDMETTYEFDDERYKAGRPIVRD